MSSIDILKQVDHPIPPRSVETRNETCLTTVSRSGSVEGVSRYCLVEPLPPPSLSQIESTVEFGKSSISVGFSTAALTPGIL